ncbi:secretin and TonB N-terminal domain-containing protein [Achromobacter insuavis]
MHLEPIRAGRARAQAAGAVGQAGGSRGGCARSCAGARPARRSRSCAFDFDLPAQPLQSALEQYSNVTGSSVVYRAALAVGRRSAAVKGIYTPEAALRMLIEGSGLAVEYTAANAVILRPAAVGAAPGRRPSASRGAFYRSYYGVVQAGVRDALCRNPATRAGGYRAAVSFEVSPMGRVEHARVLDSTGDTDKDGEIVLALDQTVLDKAPPADLEQPFVMLIVPESPEHDQGCPAY